MMRDDSTGGWVPMGGGGLSNVSVRKRKIHHEENDQPCKHEYLIYGKRLSDQSVVLSCTIKKDFEYNKVMPTFHHWKTGNKKFGLTFQTAADARAFDKGVRLAVEDLLDVNSLACPHKHYYCRGANKKGISEASPLHQYNLDVGEDDVFMQLDLPVDKPVASKGTPTKLYASLGSHSPSPELSEDHPYYQLHHGGLHASKSVSPPNVKAGRQQAETSYPMRPRQPNELVMASQPAVMMASPGCKSSPPPPPSGCLDKDYSYVKFPRRLEPPHEYSYPKLIDTCKRLPPELSHQLQPLSDLSPIKKATPPTQSAEEKISAAGSSNSSTTSRKSRRSLASLILPCSGGSAPDEAEDNSHAPLSPPEPPSAGSVADNSTSMTLTCAHCRESFNLASNQRGACPLAPDDWARSAVETVTCLSCAKCLLYHCMSDAEGDYGGHPCACSNADGSRGRRWLGLTLLSVLVPCLCCYLPLMACYKSGAACSLCGGRHQAAK